jgi:hypothetical protein
MSLVETPEKKVAKRGRTSVKEHANDYCRICRCKFKLARCSSINLFQRSTRENFDVCLADLCSESKVSLVQADNLSNRVYQIVCFQKNCYQR